MRFASRVTALFAALLFAAPVLIKDIKERFHGENNLCMVSPDVGGVVRARAMAKRLNADLAIVDKRRAAPGEIATMTVIGEVRDRVCVIVDDIVDTAGTLVKASELLIGEGASEVHAYITHGVLSGPAVERIEKSPMKSLVVTDTIALRPDAPPVIDVISCAPMLADTIRRIFVDDSVSEVFGGKNHVF